MASNSEIGLFLTRRCPLQCAHCAVSSRPTLSDPDDAVVKHAVCAVARSRSIERVCITGGEPFLRLDLLRDTVEALTAAAKEVSVVTSGYWATDLATATAVLERAFARQCVTLWLSIDVHHGEFLGAKHYESAIVAAQMLGITVNVVTTYLRDWRDAERYYESVVSDADVRALVGCLKYQPVFQIGRGTDLCSPSDRAGDLPEGYCGRCTPHVNAHGDVGACCSEFNADRGNPLLLGNVADTDVDALLARSDREWLIQAVRTIGPSALARAARGQLPEHIFERRYLPHDICAVCIEVMKSPAAVHHLRRRFEYDDALRRRIVLLRSLLYDEDGTLWPPTRGEKDDDTERVACPSRS